MVQTEDMSASEDGWSEVFERSRSLVSPSSQTVRWAAESLSGRSQSHGFQLRLSRLTAAHLPQQMSEGEGDGGEVTYELRVTLFDRNHQHFFGRTWKSRPQRMKHNKITLNEVLYFHTSVRVPSTMLVVELVGLCPRPDGSQQALGRGFTVLELFSSRPEAQPPEGDTRLNLNHGSPRSLLHPLLKDTDDYSSLLRPIDGAHLDCVIKTHPAMDSIMHLLPENVLVSGEENIPGLAASPTGDALLRPQLLHRLPFSLSTLSVSLQPSLDTFESQLLLLINTDCRNTKQPGAEGTPSTVVVQERRLHVGVHNGWCFLEPPQVVVLEPVAPGTRGRADSSPGKDSSPPQRLGLRSSLELLLSSHPALTVLFQLEYVFSAPLGPETMLSATSTSRAAFLQCLRWGVWSPFPMKGGEAHVPLQGGAQPNPHRAMVYSTGTAQAQDSITFRLSSLEGRTSSPKLSRRTKHRRHSARSQDQKPVPLVSPPESPPGPGLSLSQLAATSRCGAASPWQQVSASPLAPAHQLSHAYSGGSSLAHLEVDLQQEGLPLQELPFTPIHAPLISLGPHVTHSRAASSRSSLAHLSSAGFPDVVDRSGQVVDVLDPTEPVTFDPRREDTDPLQGNLLLFQFLAFTRVPTAGVGADWPDNIHFTFQFYRFPAVTSQPLRLLPSEQRGAGGPLPCVLALVNTDGTVISGPPGLEVQFRVDGGFLKPGEGRWFLRYLALHTMHIHVWDSDSLLLIGSTAIELKCMLRQGRPGVQALHELDVLTTDYGGEDTQLSSTGLGGPPAISPMTVQTISRGRLHIRTGNVGCVDGSSSRRPADLMGSAPHIIGLRPGTAGFRGGRLSASNYARSAAQAQRLGRRLLPERAGPPEAVQGQHKLSCMAAVQHREKQEDAGATDGAREALLAKELGQIKASKAEVIANMLSQAITTQHLLYASLGTAEYREFVLTNPFNVPQTVSIHSDDPELSVITSTEEWAHFKALSRSPTPLEENMFQLQEGSPAPRVYLRPKETVHIPLKYQSFLCDHALAPQGPSFPPPGKGTRMAKKSLSNMIAAKTIKVTFRAEDGRPMAICQLSVEPLPHAVAHSFRLYQPQLCFMKKAIRLPPWHSPAEHTVRTPDDRIPLSARCSDPNIVCQTTMPAPGEPQDVYLKVPGSPSPLIKMFFVMVFTDKWTAAPSQMWQVYVHFLERVDVSCVTGQRSCQSLVLRGKQAVRKVDPEGTFVLPPGAVQELQLKVQPWRAGSGFLYVTAVDVEHRRLVSAWLLCISSHRPVVSKTFEVCVPVGSGRGSSRKITYTNPYSGGRTCVLRSDHPHLLQFKEDSFEIGGRARYTIGLRFAPSQSPGSEEILLYVNNPQEKTEEAFCVRVTYQ